MTTVKQTKINHSKAVAVTVTLTDGRIDTYLIPFDGSQVMSHNGVSATALIAARSSLHGQSDSLMVEGTSDAHG